MVLSNPLKILCLVTALSLTTQANAAQASAGNTPSSRLYCCIDLSGKQSCGDILPQACYGRAYREIGPNGQTIREVAAPLTTDQRLQRARQDELRRAENAKQQEQLRKDRALLNTYGSLDELEIRRKRALNETLRAIKNAEESIVVTRARRKKFEDEAEFYKNRTLPPEVDLGFRETEFEIKTQEMILATKRKEVETLRAKFDEDQKRLLEILPPKTGQTQPR